MSIRKLASGKYEFQTQGIRFRQNPKSPVQFAFAVSSNELTKFCGVARKSEDMLSNYQRAIDNKRVKTEVTPFFRNPENCSPTAIVISLQDTNICSLHFESEQTTASQAGDKVSFDTLTLQFTNTDECTDAEIITLAKQFLDSRLQDEPKSDSQTEASEPLSELDADAEANETVVVEMDEENEEQLDEEDQVEIGKSMLEELRKKLDNASEITQEVLANLREMLKPALVIDGQHRLFGAAGVEEDLPVLVCSLVRPSWKEQVFQFVVVNDKASGIPKPFITSLAGMSLTASELDELRDRLTQAGLKLWEVEVMQRMGYDSRSPFFKKIEFKVSGNNTVAGLGYQIMKKVGQAWYAPRSTGLYKIMDMLYRSPTDKKYSQKALRGFWQQNEDWFTFLCEFWGAFREKFEGTNVWEVHSNLLTAVVVEMLQEDFFLYLDSTKDILWNFQEDDSDKRRSLVMKTFREITSSFVAKHKPTIYTKEWKASSLAHSDGRKALADFFRKISDGVSLANHPIYSGQV